MKTTFDQDLYLFTILDSSSLKDNITGKIYRGGNIIDHTKENVVIKSITIDGSQIQKGVANVNVHVPDLIINNTRQPNTVKLQDLTDRAVEVLEDQVGDDYGFYVESQNLFEDQDGINNHFVNIRIRFNHFPN
jgi:hypothetical protein